MSATTLAPVRTDTAVADLRWWDLHSVDRVLAALPDARVRRAVQDWVVGRLGVLHADLPASASVRAGVVAVAGREVLVLAYRTFSHTQPTVWTTLVPEVTR